MENISIEEKTKKQKQQEYYQRNKDKIIQDVKVYRQTHKEQLMEKQREYESKKQEMFKEKHNCDICGGSYTYKNKATHLNSKKHRKAIEVPMDCDCRIL